MTLPAQLRTITKRGDLGEVKRLGMAVILDAFLQRATDAERQAVADWFERMGGGVPVEMRLDWNGIREAAKGVRL